MRLDDPEAIFRHWDSGRGMGFNPSLDGGRDVMRVGKTEQDRMPVAKRPRVQAWEKRLEAARKRAEK